jgi:hypothetical protein
MLKPILLMEDDPGNPEPTLVVLDKGQFAIGGLGVLRAVLNEPPPGSMRVRRQLASE